MTAVRETLKEGRRHRPRPHGSCPAGRTHNSNLWSRRVHLPLLSIFTRIRNTIRRHPEPPPSDREQSPWTAHSSEPRIAPSPSTPSSKMQAASMVGQTRPGRLGEHPAPSAGAEAVQAAADPHAFVRDTSRSRKAVVFSKLICPSCRKAKAVRVHVLCCCFALRLELGATAAAAAAAEAAGSRNSSHNKLACRTATHGCACWCLPLPLPLSRRSCPSTCPQSSTPSLSWTRAQTATSCRTLWSG